jgi:hypothetical protein
MIAGLISSALLAAPAIMAGTIEKITKMKKIRFDHDQGRTGISLLQCKMFSPDGGVFL